MIDEAEHVAQKHRNSGLQRRPVARRAGTFSSSTMMVMMMASTADHAHDQAVPLRGGADADADAQRGIERDARLAVLHQLHAEDQADAAHVADQRDAS